MVIAELRGIDRLLEAERTIGAKTEGIFTEHLKKIGDRVTEDVRDRYGPYSVEGAYSVKPKVFTSGLWVVQTRKKSRNESRRRPNFGDLMMKKAFLPAARDNEPYALLAAELAVKEAADLYWNGA